MTDGNTAIQVSPTEDAEMAGIKQVFDKALNAIVDMSRLAKEVETLRQSVSAMQGQVDHLRRQNEWLDEMLAKVRTERDTLSHQLTEAQFNLSTITEERDRFAARQAEDLTTVQTLKERLHTSEQAHDEAQMKIMELEDQIKGHVAKLDKFQSIAKELFPEPVPTVVQGGVMVQSPAMGPAPEPTPEPEPVSIQAETSSFVPDEAPPTPTPSLARTYHGQAWAPGLLWDSGRQEYYSEV